MFSVHNPMSRHSGTFFIILLFLFAPFCSKPLSVSGSEREAFINTYVELTLAQIIYSKQPKMYESSEQYIFEQNGTSKAFMQQFISKISNNPKLQTEIYEEIINRLKELQNLPADSLDKYLKKLLARP